MRKLQRCDRMCSRCPLWVALSLDSDLADQSLDLVDLLHDGAVGTFRADLEAFVLDWAGVGDVDPASRGIYVYAQKLEFLEAVYGTELISPEKSSDPATYSGPAIELQFNA